MIQSGIFDSSYMDIKKLGNTALIFIIRRIIEIIGVSVSLLGIFIFISLITYSPMDPNFIFPDNTEIKNMFGFQGSYTSDIFFQSFGFIAYLIPVTYFFTGINIFKTKEIFILIENTFFIVLYTLIGSLFFSLYFENAFTLYINGNGGFVGNFLNSANINEKILPYEKIINLFFDFHDPTTLDRQGPDIGTQYRSEIFYLNEAQKNTAEKVLEEKNFDFKGKIVTKISEVLNYCKAEDYHQKYLLKNL